MKKKLTVELVDLSEIAEESIGLLSGEIERAGVVLSSELAADLPPIAGDRVQLQEVILNLVRNAVDAMSAVEDRPRQLVVRTEMDFDGHVRLSVQDSGTGFDSQTAERLFEEFYTTKHHGMGIGLFVSRSIIESHRGRLLGTPNERHGATFSFSVPYTTQIAVNTDCRSLYLFGPAQAT
jgi:signal transduction histidine kinase